MTTFTYQGATFSEDQVFNEANRLMRAAASRAQSYLEYVKENGSRLYPAPLSPEHEAEIYIERFVGMLTTGDTTLLVKAALAYRAQESGMELETLKWRVASRSYSEWMKS